MSVLQDAGFGLRLMARHRGLTATIVLTLGLCLGGNTALLAVLERLVLRSPPFPAPDRLVDVYSTYAGLGAEDAGSNAYRLGRMKTLGDLSVGAVLWSEEWKTLRWEAESRRLEGWWATGRVVETVGIRVVEGRGFRPDDEAAVLLDERFWREVMGGRPETLGSTVVIDEQPQTVLGVASGLPAGVAYVRVVRPTAEDLLGSQYDQRHERSGRLWLRLRPGVTLPQVRARLAALDQRELGEGTAADRERAQKEGFASRAEPVADVRNRDVRARLYFLQAAGLLVLLIAAFNVAGLLSARAGARGDEVATRVALGATRARLVRQWITEGLLLTLAGWAAGLLVAWPLLQHYPLWAGAAGDRPEGRLLTPGVLASSLALAALTAVFLGALSGAQVASMHRRTERLSLGARASATRAARRLSARVVSAQTAGAVVLVGVAGLLLLSYARVVEQDLGYDARQLVMTRVVLPADRYLTAREKDRFAVELLHRLADIPGVEAVARTSFVPTFGHPDVALHVSGREDGGEGATRVAFTQVSPGYFAAMGIPILQGRGIAEGDTAWWREAVVIDRRLARSLFPEGDAVGRRIRLGPRPAKPEAWPVVVGVAAEVHHSGWDEAHGLPMVYRPIADSGRAEFSLIVRSRRDPAELLAAVRAAVGALDPRVPLFRLGSMEDFLAESVRPRLALLDVVLAYAVLALLLTVVGIAGVLSFDVVSRTRELGVRLALGASRRAVGWLVLRQALARVAWGLAPGLLVLYAAGRLLSGLLYRTSAAEPAVYAGVALAVVAVGLVAGYFPARRALALDPVEVLRES
jgi:putative ABC transport system permease protein